MPSNLVQGVWSAAIALNTANLANGAGAIGPTIDLTTTIPYEVTFIISLTTAAAPSTLTRGAGIYLQYSVDGTTWTTFDPSTSDGLSDMQYLGFVPLQNGNQSRKALSTAGAPINRYIRIVTFNDTGVALNATSGTFQWSPITGS